MNEKNKILDELQDTCEKLLVLLKDRHIGLMDWNIFFAGRIRELKDSIKKIEGER